MSIKKTLSPQWCSQWLDIYIKSTVSRTTFYTTYLIPMRKHIVPFFKHQHVCDITPADIQRFFNEKNLVYSMEYLKKFCSILREVFAAAKDNNFCKESPVTSTLRIHSAQPFAPEKRVWNEAQYITAWNFAKQHKHGLVIKTLMETGMSRSEVLGLQCKDYDGEAKLLYIEQGLAECNMDNGR